MLKNWLWAYIADRYDEDGVLVDGDEIYEKFQVEFDAGADLEWIDSVMYSFTRCHDLTDIDIQWEGAIYERSVEANYQG